MPKDIAKYMLCKHLERRLGENITKIDYISQQIYEYHLQPINNIIQSDDFTLTENWDEVLDDFKLNMGNYIPDFYGGGKFGINFPSRLEELANEIPFIRNDPTTSELLGIERVSDNEDVTIGRTPPAFLADIGPNIFSSVIQSITEDYDYPEMKISLSMASAYHDVYSSGLPEALLELIKIAITLFDNFSEFVDKTRLYKMLLPIPGTLAERHFSVCGLLSWVAQNDRDAIDFEFEDLQKIWPYYNVRDFLDLEGQFGGFVVTNDVDPTATSLGIDVAAFLNNFRDEPEEVISSISNYTSEISTTDDFENFFGGFVQNSPVDDVLFSLRNSMGSFNFINSFGVNSSSLTGSFSMNDVLGNLPSLLSGQNISNVGSSSQRTLSSMLGIVSSTGNSSLNTLFSGTIQDILGGSSNSDLNIILSNANDIFNGNFSSVTEIFQSENLNSIVGNFDNLLSGTSDVTGFISNFDSGISGMFSTITSDFSSIPNLITDMTGSLENVFTGLNPSNLMEGITTTFESITFEGVLSFGGNMVFDATGISDLIGGDFSTFFTDFSFDGIMSGITGGLMNISIGSVFDGLPSILGGISFGNVLGGFQGLFNGVPFMQAFNVGNILGGVPVIGPIINNFMSGVPFGQAIMGGLSQTIEGVFGGGLAGLAGLACSIGGMAGKDGAAGSSSEGARNPNELAGGRGSRGSDSETNNTEINESLEGFDAQDPGWTSTDPFSFPIDGPPGYLHEFDDLTGSWKPVNRSSDFQLPGRTTTWI